MGLDAARAGQVPLGLHGDIVADIKHAGHAVGDDEAHIAVVQAHAVFARRVVLVRRARVLRQHFFNQRIQRRPAHQPGVDRRARFADQCTGSSAGGPSTKPPIACGWLSTNGIYGLMSNIGVPSSRSTLRRPSAGVTPWSVSTPNSSATLRPTGLGRKVDRLANTPTWHCRPAGGGRTGLPALFGGVMERKQQPDVKNFPVAHAVRVIIGRAQPQFGVGVARQAGLARDAEFFPHEEGLCSTPTGSKV